MDKNEQYDDTPDFIKHKVLQHVMEMEWNRYPDLDYSDVEENIATNIGVTKHQVLLGPGSASFITTLLNFFGMQRRQIVITQPSYSLFDYHCKTYDIAYTPWMLNAQLEYDYKLLPKLETGSVLFVVSPNNPVGNTIPRAMLERILRDNPHTLVILDAVYAEFCDDDFGDMLQQYDNLIIMRSFSKEMPVAGLRLGYICGSESVINTVRKLTLPFALNPLSLCFARHMLFDAEYMALAAMHIEQIISERNRVCGILEERIQTRLGKVYRSAGNFFLVRIYDDVLFTKVMDCIKQAGIKVLDTSTMPFLKNTFRVSIGSRETNNIVVRCISSALQPALQYALAG
ncbi:MAG: histidinol-phosphate aminotransferase family protein [Chitinophagaceae bacterium]|nr:histidinol-phosphate aminotransferase family protein [Chitinophagaceae bacterium]